MKHTTAWSLCVLTAGLVLVATISMAVSESVASTQTAPRSPLFSVRVQQSLQTQAAPRLATSYVSRNMGILFTKQPSVSESLDRAMALMRSNPALVERVFAAIETNAQVLAYLEANGVSAESLHRYLYLVRTNPEQVAAYLQQTQASLSSEQLGTPAPLGLNTTNPIGCVITVIALLPVALVIGLIVVVFTLRVLKCLTFDEVLNEIMQQIIQGLNLPT